MDSYLKYIIPKKQLGGVLFDIITDFTPGIGEVKSLKAAYEAYKAGKSADVFLNLFGAMPGLGKITKTKKIFKAIDLANDLGKSGRRIVGSTRDTVKFLSREYGSQWIVKGLEEGNTEIIKKVLKGYKTKDPVKLGKQLLRDSDLSYLQWGDVPKNLGEICLKIRGDKAFENPEEISKSIVKLQNIFNPLDFKNHLLKTIRGDSWNKSRSVQFKLGKEQLGKTIQKGNSIQIRDILYGDLINPKFGNSEINAHHMSEVERALNGINKESKELIESEKDDYIGLIKLFEKKISGENIPNKTYAAVGRLFGATPKQMYKLKQVETVQDLRNWVRDTKFNTPGKNTLLMSSGSHSLLHSTGSEFRHIGTSDARIAMTGEKFLGIQIPIGTNDFELLTPKKGQTIDQIKETMKKAKLDNYIFGEQKMKETLLQSFDVSSDISKDMTTGGIKNFDLISDLKQMFKYKQGGILKFL